MMSIKLPFLSVVALVAVAGCAVESTSDSGESSVTVSQADADKILAFVNYPTTTEAVLDGNVRLDSRAAKAIVAHRNGKDGVYPSSDDAPFTSIADLDA